MMVSKFMQRMLEGKCTQQKCDMERFNLMMLNGAKTSNNRDAALKNAVTVDPGSNPDHDTWREIK
jgi:hypothetical protein